MYKYRVTALNVTRIWIELAVWAKGGVTPAPESESEPDFGPVSTPDSGTGSLDLESLEPIPWPHGRNRLH